MMRQSSSGGSTSTSACRRDCNSIIDVFLVYFNTWGGTRCEQGGVADELARDDQGDVGEDAEERVVLLCLRRGVGGGLKTPCSSG